MAKLPINNFNGGEVSPYLYAREDVDGIYNKSCLKMENFIPLPYGGATRRPATKFLGESNSGKVRLIPFTFSVSENYLLEFGNQYIRVWKNDLPHTTGNSEIILGTPYSVNDLDDIKFAQSADILFLVHQDHPPQQLKRLSDTNWSFSEVDWTFPPMMQENTDVTHFITTTQTTGETILTSNLDLFQPEHVGSYFQFRVARTNDSLTLEDRVTANHVSGSINVSNTAWDFETGSTWSGRVTIDRSLDAGISFQEYITVADTRSISSSGELKNFSVSSPGKEGANTFLRVQYEEGDYQSNSFQYSLSPVDPYITSLVRITNYTSAKQVTAIVISDFQEAISSYTTLWTASTAFSVGDKVKFNSGLEYASISKDLSAFNGLCATVDNVGAADSNRTAGTYDFLDGTTTGISSTGTGAGARIRVVVAAGTGAATVTMLGVSGKNYAVNDIFTITDAALGGGGAANLTFDVETISDTFSLNNTSGGTYGDAKYFAIDTSGKVNVFSKDSSDNFLPYDQWTASGITTGYAAANNLDIAYYANHVYVLGANGSERTLTLTANGITNGPISGAPQMRIRKYDIDGQNASTFKSYLAPALGYSNPTRIDSDEQIYQPRSIGILNGKFYVSYRHFGGAIYSRYHGDTFSHYDKLGIERLGATGSFEQGFYQRNSSAYDESSADGGRGDASLPAGTPFFSDITGVSDASINEIYCVDSVNNKISFFTPEFTSGGNFDLSSEFPTTNVTASFYDDTIDGSELFWIADTDGNIKKYNFTTKSLYYECIKAVTTQSGDFSTQLSEGRWFETSPEMEHWSEGAFSDYRGYANSIAFFESRLTFAGTKNNPNTIWLSEIDNFFAFDPGTLDTDPMRITINSGSIDGIRWLVPHRALIIGTTGSEWSLGAESDNRPVTPTSFDIKRRTTYGTNSIAGLLVNSAVLFVMRQGKKLREWIFNFDAQDYVAPDLTLVAEHISGTGFKAIALQQQPDNIVWTINSDNELVGMTYERDQKVVGWHRHKCTGAFESVTVLPTDSGPDAVYVSIKLTINSQDVRYICKLDDREWGTNYLTQYNGLDYYTTVTNLSTGSIIDYDHAIGETYKVVADGTTTFTGVVDTDGDLNIGSATDLAISAAEIPSDNANHLKLTFSAPHGLSEGDIINVSGLGYSTTNPNVKYLLESGSITSTTVITTDLTGGTETFSTSGSSKATVYKLGDSTYSRVVIGKEYTGVLAPLYLNYQSRSGSTSGSKLNASMATLRFKDTVTAKTGQTEASSDLQPVKFAGTGMVSETAEAYMSNAPEYLQTVYVVSDEPQPCTVLSMTPHVDTGSIR